MSTRIYFIFHVLLTCACACESCFRQLKSDFQKQLADNNWRVRYKNRLSPIFLKMHVFTLSDNEEFCPHFGAIIGYVRSLDSLISYKWRCLVYSYGATLYNSAKFRKLKYNVPNINITLFNVIFIFILNFYKVWVILFRFLNILFNIVSFT
jgi:hypothetical protein